MGLFCLFSSMLLGQNQKIADSLIAVYESGRYEQSELDLLNRIIHEGTNPQILLTYSGLLIEKAAPDSLFGYLQKGYLQKGNAHQYMGDNVPALESFFKSLEYAKKNEDDLGVGAVLISIAGAYTSMDNNDSARHFYKQGIEVLRKTNDSIKIGTALLNAGDEYFNIGKLDSALLFTAESTVIFQNIEFKIGEAYSLGNSGMIHAQLGNDKLAEERITESITMLEELKDYYPISVYLTYMSNIYLKKNDWNTALNYANRSLELAEKYNLKEQISDANLQLAELYEKKGNFELSNAYLKNYYAYRDSLLNIEAVEEMANMRTKYEVAQKQVEVDLLDEQKKNQQLISLSIGIGLLLILIVAMGLYRRNAFITRSKQLIEKEKKRSDELLLNILPEETATELKDRGRVQAKRFDMVTVLFTDFKGFTTYSDRLSPEELVDSIDYYYSKFDEIIEKHGLEKIKTVGDAYMCAGGLPHPGTDHACKMVAAALEIVEFVKESKKSDPDGMTRFDIRIGINSGPVVAGVVGTKKFAYDIWGDTVNIASRMESNSEPGKINISDNTYQLVKENYRCTYRGEIEAKNKGKLKMYFVEGALAGQASDIVV